MLYVIWSIREAAWVTQSFTYSSTFAQAKTFSEDEAYKMCVSHAQNGAMMWMPIPHEAISKLHRMLNK